MPLVVPQLRTITLGGAVAGLGIESTSFRHGLPHESVLEMDVLTGDGKIITATPDGEHADLFAAFPNSYGSLGYATRLRIELQPVERFVALRNVRFIDLDALVAAVDEVMSTGSWAGERVDAIDGVMFAPRRGVPRARACSPTTPTPTSDYTGQSIYYRSLRERATDALTIVRLPLALGHRLVLVLGRVRACRTPAPPALAEALPAQRRLPPVDPAGAAVRPRGPGRPVARRTSARTGRPRRRDPARAHRGVPALVRRACPDVAGLALPAAPARTRRPRLRAPVAALPDAARAART